MQKIGRRFFLEIFLKTNLRNAKKLFFIQKFMNDEGKVRSLFENYQQSIISLLTYTSTFFPIWRKIIFSVLFSFKNIFWEEFSDFFSERKFFLNSSIFPNFIPRLLNCPNFHFSVELYFSISWWRSNFWNSKS